MFYIQRQLNFQYYIHSREKIFKTKKLHPNSFIFRVALSPEAAALLVFNPFPK